MVCAVLVVRGGLGGSGVVEDAMKCQRCDGCGKVATTDDQEPWSAWLALPVESAQALLLGIVKPITCPGCGGTGVEEAA